MHTPALSTKKGSGAGEVPMERRANAARSTIAVEPIFCITCSGIIFRVCPQFPAAAILVMCQGANGAYDEGYLGRTDVMGLPFSLSWRTLSYLSSIVLTCTVL
jgi:hypothetical protein